MESVNNAATQTRTDKNRQLEHSQGHQANHKQKWLVTMDNDIWALQHGSHNAH